MNSRMLMTIVLCGALAACKSPKPEPPPADTWCEAPPPWARAVAPEAAPSKPAEPAKPAAAPAKPTAAPAKPAPVVAKPTTTVEKPAPATPAPESTRTKDATGHDWSTHMGDVGFTFDVDAATKRAAEGGRGLMLFFTTPT